MHIGRTRRQACLHARTSSGLAATAAAAAVAVVLTYRRKCSEELRTL